MNDTTMGLRISSWYPCAFKMQLCFVVRRLCLPYCNPTATKGHSVHNIDLSSQLKPGFIRKEHTSPVGIEGEHLPTEVGYNVKLQSGQDPGEDDEHSNELPRDGF